MDEPGSNIDPRTPGAIACPQCGAAIAIEAGSDAPPTCPNCGADLVNISEEQPADFPVEVTVEWEEPTDPQPPDDELDGLRIRKLVQARRSAIRARTYSLVILICCLVMGVQLILTDVQEVHLYGWDFWAILYTVCAAVMVIAASVASRKAAALDRESHASADADWVHQPQFEQLSDGSQRVENLQQMMKDQ